MVLAYELVLDGEDEKVVLTDEPLDVGDAVAIDDEVWLVLRTADKRAAVRHSARFECRRALVLRNQAAELIDYAKELQLTITKAREVRE